MCFQFLRGEPWESFCESGSVIDFDMNKADRHKSRAPSLQRQTDRQTNLKSRVHATKNEENDANLADKISISLREKNYIYN